MKVVLLALGFFFIVMATLILMGKPKPKSLWDPGREDEDTE